MSLFTAQLYPGRALGFLVLGASLHDILTRLKAEPQRFPKLDLTYSPSDPILDPVILTLPANGLRLRFDGPEQRLRLVEVLDFTKNHIFFREQNKDRDLVKPAGANGETASTSSGQSGGPTFRHIYSRFLGPTYDGEFIPPTGDTPGTNGAGTYVLSYPGVAFTFPMAPSAYSPDKDVVSLLSSPSNLSAISMAVFSGDSWAQARDQLWTEVLPAIKSFAPVAKGKDVSPDEVSLIKIHGGGKLQLFRRWAGITSSAGGATNGNSGTNGESVSPTGGPGTSLSSASSCWITLGETTPQDLVTELGPPDAIYRKSDQRMYVHKIRTASSSRTRPNGFDYRHHNGYRRGDDALTDTDQSSVPTASDDDDDEEAIEDEFITGNVSGECFFNYFYLGFDVLVSTPTAPSRTPPSQSADATGSASQVPTSALRSEAPDRLVASKVVLHGNVPGSYPFNRHRRCRWSIAYVEDKASEDNTEKVIVNSETPFSQIEQHLHNEWKSIYSSDEEARQRQRGMVLNRGWGDSPGSSIELLGGWEEGQRIIGGADQGAGGARGVKGAEESTTTLYGFPGLVFEVLRNGFVSAVTVF